MSRESILNEVSIERDHQDERFGELNAKLSIWQFYAVLGEEVGEVANAMIEAKDWVGGGFHPIAAKNVRAELVQVAAVAVQIIERIDAGLGRDPAITGCGRMGCEGGSHA